MGSCGTSDRPLSALTHCELCKPQAYQPDTKNRVCLVHALCVYGRCRGPSAVACSSLKLSLTLRGVRWRGRGPLGPTKQTKTRSTTWRHWSNLSPAFKRPHYPHDPLVICPDQIIFYRPPLCGITHAQTLSLDGVQAQVGCNQGSCWSWPSSSRAFSMGLGQLEIWG